MKDEKDPKFVIQWENNIYLSSKTPRIGDIYTNRGPKFSFLNGTKGNIKSFCTWKGSSMDFENFVIPNYCCFTIRDRKL